MEVPADSCLLELGSPDMAAYRVGNRHYVGFPIAVTYRGRIYLLGSFRLTMGDAPIVERYAMRVLRNGVEFDVGYSEITVYEPRTLPVDRVLAPFIRAAYSVRCTSAELRDGVLGLTLEVTEARTVEVSQGKSRAPVERYLLLCDLRAGTCRLAGPVGGSPTDDDHGIVCAYDLNSGELTFTIVGDSLPRLPPLLEELGADPAVITSLKLVGKVLSGDYWATSWDYWNLVKRASDPAVRHILERSGIVAAVPMRVVLHPELLLGGYLLAAGTIAGTSLGLVWLVGPDICRDAGPPRHFPGACFESSTGCSCTG
ncbi:TPA: hypothetical protein HA336_00785 [Methanopyrus kandleri]|uniref:Uncharacterized protein n=1 Tax=Methanopyrus kandleri TaxID=2320 RepID=A0A832T5H7_9EURY|nr:hypothetical protein [Methanopyrus kandleri]HII69752.1 hypothetical protein [Methanopyrus kandleri]